METIANNIAPAIKYETEEHDDSYYEAMELMGLLTEEEKKERAKRKHGKVH